MGWYYGWDSRECMVRHLLAQEGGSSEVIDHSLVGNNLWMLLRRKADGFRFIVLCLIRSNRADGWGYNDVEESCGPAEVDCPERLLAQSDVIDEMAMRWRQRCRDARTLRAKQRRFLAQLKEGDLFLVGDRIIECTGVHEYKSCFRKRKQITIFGKQQDTHDVYRWKSCWIRPVGATTTSTQPA